MELSRTTDVDAASPEQRRPGLSLSLSPITQQPPPHAVTEGSVVLKLSVLTDLRLSESLGCMCNWF